MNTRPTPTPLAGPSLAADLVTCDLLCSPVAFTTAGVAGLISDGPPLDQNPFVWVLVALVSGLPVSWFVCGFVGLGCLVTRREIAAARWAVLPILHLLAATTYVAAFFWFDFL